MLTLEKWKDIPDKVTPNMINKIAGRRQYSHV